MYISLTFAVDDLKPADPEINSIFGIIFFILILLGVGLTLIYLIPLFLRKARDKKDEKRKAEGKIWFDVHKSILHKGSQQVVIPESSLEYYVCKLVFKDPKVYQTDLDVLEKAGEENKNARAVYFAVDRINNKASKAFKLEDKLLKRNRERTRLNDNYF